MGLIAIGDVHGCARSLDALLEALDPTPDDHLVFVGDYTDRGPSSRTVIDRLLTLEAFSSDGSGPRCTFLRGNHDQMMLDWVDHGEIELWQLNGGTATLESYAEADAPPRIPEAHIGFLRRTRLYLDTEAYCFVHAGLKPYFTVAENLAHETAQTFLWTRDHLAQPERAWEKPVVCGHTPQPEVIVQRDLIVVDTGCVYHHHPDYGWLSAIRLPSCEVIRVPYQED